MSYTTIFFDLDDTLLNTAQNSKEALAEIYKEYGFGSYYTTFDLFFKKYMGINLKLWDLYEHNQIDKNTLKTERFIKTLQDFMDIDMQKALTINDDFTDRSCQKGNVIEGAKDILEYLSAKYNLYILSNGFEEIQGKKLQNAGIDKFFKDVILSDHVGKNKPDPIIFEYALRKINASNLNTVMIGDNISTDIFGAYNRQIDQIWFNPQRKPNITFNDIKLFPTYMIEKLDQLKDIL